MKNDKQNMKVTINLQMKNDKKSQGVATMKLAI
jgi:hypothetical protein